MKEYRMAKGWAVFIYVAALLIIALFVWILIMPFIPSMDDGLGLEIYWLLGPAGLAMIILGVVAIIETVKGKFVIDHKKVYMLGAFSPRTLFFDEIKGYTINDKYIVIEAIANNKKKIKISSYFGKTNEIIYWLAANYQDLDLLNALQEEQEILNNENFGSTTDQRLERLSKARKTAKILNWTGGLVGVYTVFLPNSYEYAILASIAVPIVSIISLRIFKGLIHIDENNDSAHPTIFWALFASSMGLCLRALFDFNIFDQRNVWVPSILIAVIATALLVIGNKEIKFKKLKDYFTVLVVSFLMLAYSYGSTIVLNCLYDTSTAVKFKAKILSKREDSDKVTTYYFELSSWGQRKTIGEVSVSKNLYSQLGKDDQVTIYLKKGLFGIPWLVLTE